MSIATTTPSSEPRRKGLKGFSLALVLVGLTLLVLVGIAEIQIFASTIVRTVDCSVTVAPDARGTSTTHDFVCEGVRYRVRNLPGRLRKYAEEAKRTQQVLRIPARCGLSRFDVIKRCA